MTFRELQDQLNVLRFKRTILSHLVEYIDAEFLPNLDQSPKKVLLAEDKVRVPTELFEQVSTDLTTWLKNISEEEQKLLSSIVTLQSSQSQIAPAQNEVTS